MIVQQGDLIVGRSNGVLYRIDCVLTILSDNPSPHYLISSLSSGIVWGPLYVTEALFVLIDRDNYLVKLL